MFTLIEIFDALLMTLVIGYIFSDAISRFNVDKRTKRKSNVFIKQGNKPEEEYDPVKDYMSKTSGFGPQRIFNNWDDMKFAMLIAAPAIIFHELGHKFVAMSFGYNATFHAAYGWLIFALILKMINSGFIFLVPAYVSFSANTTPLQHTLIAFAGPLVNLILFLISMLILKNNKKLSRRTIAILSLTKSINIFLFFFNMIPFGPFDGAKVFAGLGAMLGI